MHRVQSRPSCRGTYRPVKYQRPHTFVCARTTHHAQREGERWRGSEREGGGKEVHRDRVRHRHRQIDTGTDTDTERQRQTQRQTKPKWSFTTSLFDANSSRQIPPSPSGDTAGITPGVQPGVTPGQLPNGEVPGAVPSSLPTRVPTPEPTIVPGHLPPGKVSATTPHTFVCARTTHTRTEVFEKEGERGRGGGREGGI